MKRSFAIAVKGIVYKDGQILALKRSKAEMERSRINKIDLWDLPGGGLQYFEKNHQGLAREIMEETSLKASILRPFDTYDIIRPAVHIVIITYLCAYSSGKITLSEEHDAFQWIAQQELEHLDMQKWMKKMLKNAFEAYQTENIKGTT